MGAHSRVPLQSSVHRSAPEAMGYILSGRDPIFGADLTGRVSRPGLRSFPAEFLQHAVQGLGLNGFGQVSHETCFPAAGDVLFGAIAAK